MRFYAILKDKKGINNSTSLYKFGWPGLPGRFNWGGVVKGGYV